MKKNYKPRNSEKMQTLHSPNCRGSRWSGNSVARINGVFCEQLQRSFRSLHRQRDNLAAAKGQIEVLGMLDLATERWRPAYMHHGAFTMIRRGAQVSSTEWILDNPTKMKPFTIYLRWRARRGRLCG